MSLQKMRDTGSEVVSKFTFFVVALILLGVIGVLGAMLATSHCPACPSCQSSQQNCPSCPACPACNSCCSQCPICAQDCPACEPQMITKYQCYDGDLKDTLGDCQELENNVQISDEVILTPADTCLTIVSHDSDIDEFTELFKVSGLIKNTCTTTRRYSRINIVLFDEDDNVLASEEGYANPPDIAPGQTNGFQYYYSGTAEDVARYTLRVSSYESLSGFGNVNPM